MHTLIFSNIKKIFSLLLPHNTQKTFPLPSGTSGHSNRRFHRQRTSKNTGSALFSQHCAELHFPSTLRSTSNQSDQNLAPSRPRASAPNRCSSLPIPRAPFPRSNPSPRGSSDVRSLIGRPGAPVRAQTPSMAGGHFHLPHGGRLCAIPSRQRGPTETICPFP